MSEDKEMTYKEITMAFQKIDTEIAVLNSLYRVEYTLDSTYTVIEKFRDKSRENRTRLTIAVNNLIEEKKKLTKSLKDIANAFNDIEEQIFISRAFEHKSYAQIAQELGVSEGYCKTVGSKIIKKVNEMITKGKNGGI